MMLDWEKVIDGLVDASGELLDGVERTREFREARMAASLTLTRLAIALRKGIVTNESLSPDSYQHRA